MLILTMARTKASVGAKISSGKSSKARCSVAPTTNSYASTGSDKSSKSSSSGGNPVCPRETPKWQKPITNFFITNESKDDKNECAGGSTKHKRNVIYSDDEDDVKEEEREEKPKNKELDETIELEPLTGEDSHKIEEYYEKKGKGKGKKSNKENINGNVRTSKRDLDEAEEIQAKKRKID